MDGAATAALMTRIRPTHLMHFAWYAEPGKFWHSLENFRWLEASLQLLRNFREAGGGRAVLAGSCAEYDWDYGYCRESITPCRPVTPYGACKNALREVLQSYSETTGLSTAWGRVFSLYGPYEHPARLVATTLTSLLRGEPARCSHGNQLREFMHVEDVASAFVALLNSQVNGAVNISTGCPVALREIILAAADFVGASSSLAHFGAIQPQENDPPLLVGDSRRLSGEVGWRPRYDLYTGLEQTANWWKSQLTQGW
jgi:nucleoside-diphosphate-sugar epimerase